MILVLIPLVVLVGIVLGVRVIQGRTSATSRQADLACIENWKKARKSGPVLHSIRSVAPFIFGYCALGPVTKYWLDHGKLGFPTDKIGFYIVFAVFATAVIGFFSWKILHAGAREASDRLSQWVSE